MFVRILLELTYVFAIKANNEISWQTIMNCFAIHLNYILSWHKINLSKYLMKEMTKLR